MQLLSYSERGFINAFFYGVFHQPNPSEIIREFLKLAHWPLLDARPSMIETATVDTILIEQSFSDFGDADVLILVSTAQEKVAVFCEAKRGKWKLKKEWSKFKTRFQNDDAGDESNVFRQLYYKQRMAQGYAAGEDLDTGIEFDGVLRPVRGTRCRKIGKNKVVLKAADKLTRYVTSTYYLILTPEPWGDETGAALQEARDFGPAPNDPRPREWDINRWGVVSLRDMVQLCRDRHLDHAADVADFNDGQLF
ncbi:MAG: hypothetical protein U0792_19745 [Gemmataceae bacterium]